MEDNNIQPMIPADATDLFGNADVAEKYRSVYGNLDPNRKSIVNMATCMFRNAMLSYQSLNDKFKDPTNRVCIAGVHAECFVAQLEYFKVLTDTDDDTVADKLQKISEWLEKKEWIHLPSYEGKDGRTVFVTAAGMIDDMKSTVSAVNDLRRSMGETGGSTRTQRRHEHTAESCKRPDFDDTGSDTPMQRLPHSIERRIAR